MAELLLKIIVGGKENFCVDLNKIKDAAEKSEWVKGMLKYEGCSNGEIHLPQTDPDTFKNFIKVMLLL